MFWQVQKLKQKKQINKLKKSKNKAKNNKT